MILGQALNRISKGKTLDAKMKQRIFPPEWDEEKVRRVIAYYERQSEDQALAEDEAAFQGQSQTLMEVPSELVPVVRQLIAKRQG